MAKIQLSGGSFQSPSGELLVNGYLLMSLSQDALADSTSEVAAGKTIQITLDADGNVGTTTPQYVWPNDQLTPANTFYSVSAYSTEGQLVWGPNSQQIFSTPSPYNVGAWVPGVVNTLNTSVPTYDIGMFLQGAYTPSQLVTLLAFERQVRFFANFAPSTATIGTNPTGTITFIINKNGTQVGTVSIPPTGVATFSSSGTVFNTGDVLTVVAPSTIDATAENVSILLSGSVTGS